VRPVPTSEDVVRHEHFVVPSKTEARLFDAKVIVLMSPITASAAEHFTLALKRTGRAIVIGEPTAGAGHYGSIQPITEHFAAFIPVGRTFDPDTGKGWEATGVAPDVVVPAANALVEALVRSGIGRVEAERISAGVVITEPMIRRRPRTPA
jgi:C-terminal processing protease CtpA/Prc